MGNVRSVAEQGRLLGDEAGSFRYVGGTAGGDLHVFAHRTLGIPSDGTANDSDKTIPVPAGVFRWVHGQGI